MNTRTRFRLIKRSISSAPCSQRSSQTNGYVESLKYHERFSLCVNACPHHRVFPHRCRSFSSRIHLHAKYLFENVHIIWEQEHEREAFPLPKWLFSYSDSSICPSALATLLWTILMIFPSRIVNDIYEIIIMPFQYISLIVKHGCLKRITCK